MSKIRLTKKFTFEMAHALHNYSGKCKNIHGHSYILYVTVRGVPIVDAEDNTCGMVMDFSDLKYVIKKYIVDRFDHSVVLNNRTPMGDFENSGELFEKCDVVSYQPTCENMVLHFVNILKEKLPKRVELVHIRLHETADSYAEWLIEDN